MFRCMSTLKKLFVPVLVCSLMCMPQAAVAARSFSWYGMQLQMKPAYAKIFISRMKRANPDFQRLVRQASHHTQAVVKVSGKGAPSGGNYTATQFDSNGTTFEIGLNRQNFRLGNLLGYHLQMHELSHLVANLFAYGKVYSVYFDFWQQSSAWRTCFPQKSPPASDPCVSPDEIFADQMAFWATGNGKIRSWYRLPPLAKFDSMKKLARLSGFWKQAGLR